MNCKKLFPPIKEKKMIKFTIFIIFFLGLILWGLGCQHIQDRLLQKCHYNIQKNYSANEQNPVEQAISFSPEYQKLTISFDFKITGYGQYHNIFQTGHLNSGIRMEFTNPHDVYWSSLSPDKKWSSGVVGKNLEHNKTYHLLLVYAGGKVTASLDGHVVSTIKIDHLPEFNAIIFGRGYSADRYFRGNISNISIVTETTLFILLHLQILLAGVILVFVLVLINALVPYKFLSWKCFISVFGWLKNPITVLITALLLTIISYYLLKAFGGFYQYKEVGNPKMLLTWETFEFFLSTEIKRAKAAFFADSPLPDNESKLPTFRISINSKYLDELNSDLPYSGKQESYPAFLKVNDKDNIFKIKLRYRGDNLWHWLYKQKSLRISFEKNKPYNMRSRINLVNPPYIFGFRDVATFKVSQELGILSPECYPVRVFINGEYMGVYIFLDQPDESFLRRNKVMPGSIYFGDDSDDDSETVVTKYGASNLFFEEARWVKQASRNAEQKSNREDIQTFIKIINEPSQQKFYDLFFQFFDVKKYFEYMALDRITGTWMHDMNHNHKLYFDPYKGKFEPIQWDVRHFTTAIEKDRVGYVLLQRIQENPLLDFEVDKLVYRHYLDNITNKLFDIYKKYTLLAEKDLLADRYKEAAAYGFATAPYTYSEQAEIMEKDFNTLSQRKEHILNKYINDANISYHYEKLQDNRYLLSFFVTGNTPVEIDISKLLLNGSISLLPDNTFEKSALSNKEILYPGRKVVRNTSRVVYMSNKKVVPAIEHYAFVLKSTAIGNDLEKIRYSNAITGRRIIPKRVDQKNVRDAESLHPWKFKEKKIKQVILSGNIYIPEDKVFEDDTAIMILPGTKISLAPNASLFFHGNVTAEGTEDAPIEFDSAIDGEPWGIVVVQGQSGSGSVFRYCRFLHGSVDSNNLIYYTAPLNIHDVKDFTVENCYFAYNNIGDDAMHVAYSQKGLVKNNVFENTRMDALDIDIANVVVEGNMFLNIGNDAVDIMTSTIEVRNNLLANTGDKGVSIGEMSTVDLYDNTFVNNFIGIEVKDNSVATSKDSLIINAETYAIHLYNKNKRYDKGGSLTAEGTVFLGNAETKLDKHSTAEFQGTVEDKISNYTNYLMLDRVVPVDFLPTIRDLLLKSDNMRTIE